MSLPIAYISEPPAPRGNSWLPEDPPQPSCCTFTLRKDLRRIFLAIQFLIILLSLVLIVFGIWFDDWAYDFIKLAINAVNLDKHLKENIMLVIDHRQLCAAVLSAFGGVYLAMSVLAFLGIKMKIHCFTCVFITLSLLVIVLELIIIMIANNQRMFMSDKVHDYVINSLKVDMNSIETNQDIVTIIVGVLIEATFFLMIMAFLLAKEEKKPTVAPRTRRPLPPIPPPSPKQKAKHIETPPPPYPTLPYPTPSPPPYPKDQHY